MTKHFLYRVFLQFFQVELAFFVLGVGNRKAKHEIVILQLPGFGKDYGAFDHMLKFTHVSRPGIRLHPGLAVRRKSLDLFSHFGGKKLQETAGKGLFIALLLFVGIPLPGTGAWTGTLAASFLDMDFKSSVIAVMLGVMLAGVIMGLASAGVFGAISALIL